MRARSPFFIERMFFSAAALVTPSQVAFFSRTRSSHEYVLGSVLRSQKAMLSLVLSVIGRGRCDVRLSVRLTNQCGLIVMPRAAAACGVPGDVAVAAAAALAPVFSANG